MASKNHAPESEGRNTRSRAKQLECTIENGLNVSSRQRRNTSTSGKKNQQTDESFKKPLDVSDADFSSSTKKRISRTPAGRKKKSLKVNDPSDTGTSKVNNANKTPEKPPPVLLPATSPESLVSEQTPQTSPVVVSLSPKRKSKTPKKSPKELASPKSHTDTQIELTKVPRKLILPIDSPMSDQSVSSRNTKTWAAIESQNSTSRKDTFDHEKTPKKSPTGKVMRSTSSFNLKHGIRRFSKSPKIVLRTPKPKSRKSKSPRGVKFPVRRYTMGGNESRTPIKKASKIPLPNSDPGKRTLRKREKLESVRSLPNSTATNSLAKSSPISNAKIALKQPVVLLHRLPLSDITTPLKNITLLDTKRTTDTRMHSPIISSAKASPLEETVKVIRPSPKSSPRLSDKAMTKNRSHLKPKSPVEYSSTSIDLRKKSSLLVSSTPHDKKRNTTLDDVSKIAKLDSPSEKTNNWPIATGAGNSLIENISEPSLSLVDIDQTKPNGEIEGSIQELKKDGTYELLEPKTPNLRDKVRKQNSQEANVNTARDGKKNVRVRFANPTVVIESLSNSSIQRAEKGHIKSNHTSNRNNPVRKTLFDGGNPSKKSSTLSRKRSGSVTNGNMITSAPPTKKRRSNSITDENRSIHSQLSVSAQKSDSILKNSASKKVPNFAKIHNRMFSKMESIVDANKRIEARHNALTTDSSTHRSTILINDTANGPYNRFGFKVRKKEATESVTHKTQIHNRPQKQQQKNKAFLKGVRMNRRFELQMKARNIEA